tara:strand:- start:2664 stop:4205 length:1542 start_codon:yes stop_codon:yes gene_type:complete
MGVAETIEIPPLSDELSAMKDEGNEYFRSGEYLKAAGSYTKAIKVRPRLCQKRPPGFVEDPSLTPSPCPHRNLQNAGKDATERVELAPVFSNRSASFLKLSKVRHLPLLSPTLPGQTKKKSASRPTPHLPLAHPRQVKQALADADVCVKLRPDWEKSYFRRGMALEANGDDNDAIAAFEAALKTDTGANNPEIARRVKHLKTKVRPSNIHVPKAKVPTKSTSPATGTGPKGDPKWLLTAKSPGEPVPARIAAVNEVGTWLAQHLERSLKKTPGESEWFFEDKEVVAFLDAGVFGSMLDVLTHTVVSIIAAEQKGTEEAAASALAGADLAGAAAGVLHNLLHPSLRAWGTRNQTQALLMTLQQVLWMAGCPLKEKKGEKVKQNNDVRQFTALAAKILSNPGALAVLTGHHSIARARLQLLRSIVQRAGNKGKEEEVTNAMTQSAMALVLLQRCRVSGGFEEDGTPKPAWEPAIDRMLDDEGADEMRAEVAAVIEQHSLLAGAFKKFGFEGSVGL